MVNGQGGHTPFHSQLMSVTEAGEFVAALGNVRITGVVRDDDELDTLLVQAGDRDFWIHQGAFPELGSDRWIGASIPVVDLLDPTRYGQSSGDVWTVLEPEEVKSLSAGEAAEVRAPAAPAASASPPPAAPVTRQLGCRRC